MSTQITNITHENLSLESSKVYYVLWDCETQSELWRGNKEEYIKESTGDNFGMFGGGTYEIYNCLQGYSIKEIIPRHEGRLQILLIEDKE